MARCVAITTIDNPCDPLEDFAMWLKHDMRLGYNTCAYLDRIAHTSDKLSDAENLAIIEAAIDEIVAVDPFNIYVKVVGEE